MCAIMSDKNMMRDRGNEKVLACQNNINLTDWHQLSMCGIISMWNILIILIQQDQMEYYSS